MSVTGGADDNITQQQIPTYAGDAECCCAAVHTQPEEHNEYTEHTAVNNTAIAEQPYNCAAAARWLWNRY